MRRYEPGNQGPPGGIPDRKSDEQANRRLIRPNLSEIKDRLGPRQPRRKQIPPADTNAEAFYYPELLAVLKDGEELRGVIEWYDRTCIKVNRQGAPNLMVMKDCIKYMYKAEELDSRSTSQDGI